MNKSAKMQTINMTGKPGSFSIYDQNGFSITGHVIGHFILDKRKREGWSVTHIPSGFRIAKRFSKLSNAKKVVPLFEKLVLEAGLKVEDSTIRDALRTAHQSGAQIVRDFAQGIRDLAGTV